jgi:choline dehydrogenase-like flavoprotein
MVLRIEHGGRGKPTGLVYADAQGNRHRQEARVVCVAGNSIESPRLPLSSASPMFTGAACNPTVTIVALAIRQAEHLAGRMARGEV